MGPSRALVLALGAVALVAVLLAAPADAGKKAGKNNAAAAAIALRDLGPMQSEFVDKAVTDKLIAMEFLLPPANCNRPALRDCRECVKTAGCYHSPAGCKAFDAEGQSIYLTAPLGDTRFSRTFVDAAKFLVMQYAIKGNMMEGRGGMSEAIEAGEAQFTAWLDAHMDEDLTKLFNKNLGSQIGGLGQMCSGGWLAPGMMIPGEDQENTVYMVERFVANGSMKVIYQAIIMDKDGAVKEIDGKSVCVVKVNKKKPDASDPKVMADVRRETVAQLTLNNAGVTKDPRRMYVEAMYDDVTFRGTSVIASEFLPLPAVAEATISFSSGYHPTSTDFMLSGVNIDALPDAWRSPAGLKSLLKSWLEAVGYMSDRGFIHHDMHSKNAMFATSPANEPMIKLIDFGATMYALVSREEDQWGDDGRFRMDMYGQATNPGAPYSTDTKQFIESLKADAASTVGKWYCGVCKEKGYGIVFCPVPDFWTTAVEELEAGIPHDLDNQVCTYNTLPYVDQYFQDLAVEGKYCREDSECMAKHSRVRNNYDTVNLIFEWLPMVFCYGKPDCVRTERKTSFLLPAEVAAAKQAAAGDGDDGTPDEKWVKAVTAASKARAADSAEWQAAQKITASASNLFVCMPNISVEEKRAGYRALGINFPDGSETHDATSIIQAFKWLWRQDANADLGDIDRFIAETNLGQFLVDALTCDQATRPDVQELLEHAFFGGVRKYGNSEGALHGATAGLATVELAGTDDKVDASLQNTGVSELSVRALLDDRTWPWANIATVKTNRFVEAPYVTPDQRIEVDLKTGNVFVKGYDLKGHANAKEFVKHLFRLDGTGSLPIPEAREGKRYLWTVSADWRFIIAPETQIPDGEWTVPASSPAYAGEKFEASSRPLKHGDLTPGYLFAKKKLRSAKTELAGGAGPDSETNPYTPVGHNYAMRNDELMQLYKGSNTPYERGCIIAASRMLGRDIPENVKGLVEGASMDKMTMTTPATLGEDAWGQCRGPQRLAGELYFIRVDEASDAEATGLGRPGPPKRLSLAPTKLSKFPAPQGKTMRWVMDPEGSAMVQRDPSVLDGTFGSFASVHRVRVLLKVLKAVGLDTEEVWTNTGSLDTMEDRVTALPTPDKRVAQGEELQVRPGTNGFTCTVHNPSDAPRRFTLRCKNPKTGFRKAPTVVRPNNIVGPRGNFNFSAEDCLAADPRCEIVNDQIY